jgi:hypothetical protein
MKRHHVVCGFAFLFVLLTTMQTQAAVRPSTDNRQFKESKRVVFVSPAEFSRIASRAGVTIRTVKISKRDLAKLASSGPKGCGCIAAPQDVELSGFGGCFYNCLARWANTTAIAICGGGCIAAGTGNPVGIGICAACLGIEEWIVAGCSLKCVWFSSKNIVPKMPPNSRRSQSRNANLARLSLNPTTPGPMH